MDLLVWFGMKRCAIRQAIHIKKVQDWARNYEGRRPKLGQKRCKIGLSILMKKGAQFSTKLNFQKGAQSDKSISF